MMKHAALVTAALFSICLDGCADIDPLTAPGRWNPSGVNDANLAVQVANPNDLLEGQSVRDSDGQQAAEAVARLRQDRLKPLPDASGTAPAAATPAPGPGGATGGS